MTPTSNPIGFNDVLTELQRTNPSRTNPIWFSDTDVLALAGVPGPVCGFSDLMGKSVMTVSASDVSVTVSTSTGTHTGTGSSIATVSGGSGGNTFSWAYVSGDTFTLSGATTSTCTFSHFLNAGDDFSGVYRVTAVDSSGHPASTDIAVTMRGL